jgi:SAM-dependent methyltransferase
MTEQMDYDAMWKEEKPFADRLAWYITKVLKPQKVLDVGCGPGMHVDSLRHLGVNAWGYDIDDRVQGKNGLIQTSIFDINETGDLVMCIEVAEHIPSELNDKIVSSIVNMLDHRGILIWTAAIPGQGGVGHINCQPKSFGYEKFTNAGLLPMNDLTNHMLTYVRQGYHMGWFTQNAQCFMKLGNA